MIDRVIIHNTAKVGADAYITQSGDIHEVKRPKVGALKVRVMEPSIENVKTAVKYASLVLDEANGPELFLYDYILRQSFAISMLTFDSSIDESYWKIGQERGEYASAINLWYSYFQKSQDHNPTPSSKEDELSFVHKAEEPEEEKPWESAGETEKNPPQTAQTTSISVFVKEGNKLIQVYP